MAEVEVEEDAFSPRVSLTSDTGLERSLNDRAMERLLSDLVELFEISDKGRPVELVLSIANGGAGVDIESADICASLRFRPVDVLCH